MLTTAAPSAGVALLGTFGFGGAAFFFTVVLYLGVKGERKIKFNQNSSFWFAFATGQLYALAGGMWVAAGSMSEGLSSAMREGFGDGTSFGPGAVAAVMVAVALGKKMSNGLAAVLGILSPPLFTVAGGVFAIFTTLLTSGLTQVFGG